MTEIAPAKRAVRILKRWHTNSSKLRITFASDYTLFTCHGTVYSMDEPCWIWCLGNDIGDEIRFDLEGSVSIALKNDGDIPEPFEFLRGVLGEFVSITWMDGTRLNLVEENPLSTMIS